jgi:hypothetical protein
MVHQTVQRSSRELFDKHSIKLHLHLKCHFANVLVSAVIQDAVIKHQVHILLELQLVFVGIQSQLTLYRAKVHWVLYNRRIV